MDKKKIIIFCILLINSFQLSLFSIESANNERLIFDNFLYQIFSKTPSFKRDEFLEKRLNRVIVSQGRIRAIEKVHGYKKNFRIICESSESKEYHLLFYYYIYFNKKNTQMALKKDFKFEFVGQMMNYTPFTTLKNSYIIDIVLEKGAIIID